MFLVSAWSVLSLAVALVICVAVVPEGRGRPVARSRLAVPTLLIAVATISMLYLPPYAAVSEPQVLMMGLVAAVLGVGRGAFLGLQVDNGTGRLLLQGAREGAVVAVLAALVMLVGVAATALARSERPLPLPSSSLS